MHDIPSSVRLSFQPKAARKGKIKAAPKRQCKTEGFVYLARLTARDLSRYFVSLILPRDEWRARLGAKAFDALPHDLPVYIDPFTQKPCHLGLDIQFAQWRATGRADAGGMS